MGVIMSMFALEILDAYPCKMYVSGKKRETIKLYIHVWGVFPTSGWSDPELVLRMPRPGTVHPSIEGFAEFDFIASPPPSGSIILDAMTPILCETVVEVPQIVHGVRVHGQSGFQEKFVRFDTPTSGCQIAEGDSLIPIPWLVARGGADVGG